MKFSFARAIAIATSIAVASPVNAQLVVTADFGAYSEYQWRGLTFTNRPVVQPDLILTYTLGKTAVATGAWANVELLGYDGVNDISVVGGKNGTSPTAWTFWSEASRTVGRFAMTGGVNIYAYPMTNGIAAAYNSIEPYAKVALTAPLNPRVTACYDVDAIRGAYIEGALTHAIALGHSRVLSLGATGGWSAGQAIRAGSMENAYFENDGPVVADLSASVSLPMGGATAIPGIHVTRAFDTYTSVVAPGRSQLTKIWVGLSFSYSKQVK